MQSTFWSANLEIQSQRGSCHGDLFSRIDWRIAWSRYHQVSERRCLFSFREMKREDERYRSRCRIGNFVRKPRRNGCPPIGRIERNAVNVYDRNGDVHVRVRSFPLSLSRRTKSFEDPPEIRAATRTTELEIRRIFCPASTSPRKKAYPKKAATDSTEYSLDRPGPFREDRGPGVPGPRS